MSSCKHWKEMDGERGPYEYCAASKMTCYCCAVRSECRNGLYDDVETDRDDPREDR